jgi:hypothetical protein
VAVRAWVEVFFFLRRNPMIASSKAQNLKPGRAQKMNLVIVNDHFAKLWITMEELGVMNKPESPFITSMMKDVFCAFTNDISCTRGLNKC